MLIGVKTSQTRAYSSFFCGMNLLGVITSTSLLDGSQSHGYPHTKSNVNIGLETKAGNPSEFEGYTNMHSTRTNLTR